MSRFGGILIEEPVKTNRFGGMPIEQEIAPATESPQGNIGNSIASGGLAGFDDEILGTMGGYITQGLVKMFPDKFTGDISTDELVAAGRQSIIDNRESFAAQNPKQALAGEIGGSLATLGVGGAKVAGVGINALNKVQTATKLGGDAAKLAKAAVIPAVGAVEGGVIGAGEAETGERLDGAKTGAKVGAAFGAGGQVVAKGVSTLAKNSAVEKLVKEVTPSIDDLKNKSRAFYDSVKAEGATLKPNAYRAMLSKITSSLEDQGYRPRQHSGINTALADMADELGKPVSFTTVDSLRKALKDSTKELGTNSSRLANVAVDEIDEFVANLKPNFIDGKTPMRISEGYGIARKDWAKAKKAELIRDLFTGAEVQASGLENGVRTKMRQIFNNPRKRKLFSQEEQKAIKLIANGQPIQNILKNIGKFGVSGGHQGQALLPALGAAFGGIDVLVVGSVSKKIAERMTAKHAKQFEQLVLNGQDVRKIAQTYLSEAPGKRNGKELAELFVNASPESLKKLQGQVKNRVVSDAIGLALSGQGVKATTSD